jgi:hypothetical protein
MNLERCSNVPYRLNQHKLQMQSLKMLFRPDNILGEYGENEVIYNTA